MNDTAATERNQPPLLDVMAVVNALLRRWVLIAACAVIAVVVAGAYVAVTKPTYTANAVILVDPREAHTTDTDNVLSGIGSDSAAIASQVAVISSRDLLGAVFDAEGLASDPEYAAGDWLSSLRGSAAPTRDMVFEKFTDNVGVEREGLTYVIDVSFTSHDPEKAARIANAIVQRYVSGQASEKADANAEVSDLLKTRIAALQEDVLTAERAVEDFKVKHSMFDSGSVQSQIEQLSNQLLSAQDAARQADTRYQQALSAGKSPQGLISLTEILTSASAEKLRDDYNARSTALASAQSSFGNRHPTVQKLAAEVAQVEALMVKEVERITEELKASRDLAATVVSKTHADIAALRTQANQSNQMAVELRQLERNADASRQVLEQFQKRSEETGQYELLQFADARVITKATAPLRAAWPKPSLLLPVAAVLGLALGSGAALLLGAPAPAAAGRRNKPRRPLFARGAVATRRQAVAAATAAAAAKTPGVKAAPEAKVDVPVGEPLPVATPAATATVTAATPAVAAPAPAPAAAPMESANDAEPPQAPVAAPAVTLNEKSTVEEAIAELRRTRGYAELT